MTSKTYLARGGAALDLSGKEGEELFTGALSRALADRGGSGPVIILPPDATRFHSRAGYFTDLAVRELRRSGHDRLGAIMPALGTHSPMTGEELGRMFPGSPRDRFIVHNWRRDVAELGRLEADFVERVSAGAVRYDWPVQVNRLLESEGPGSGGFSLILSIGQVVPHEVIGMANHAKNLFVGTGGKEAIDKSHFAGAAYGMERMMGRAETPVRALFDEGFRRFGSKLPPVLWALTVLGPRGAGEAEKSPDPLALRGLFIGFGRECFEQAAALAREINVELLDEPVRKAVVYLEPEEYRSTWLGNKAIYRTRMAIAGGGELLVLAPGLERFGEDPGMDALIRRYGYRPGAEIIEMTRREKDLGENLSAAAHLIHGSSEGRFTVRYCPGPGLGRGDIEAAGFAWGDLEAARRRYPPERLNRGWNTLPGGERVFFVPNPALGLWAERSLWGLGG